MTLPDESVTGTIEEVERLEKYFKAYLFGVGKLVERCKVLESLVKDKQDDKKSNEDSFHVYTRGESNCKPTKSTSEPLPFNVETSTYEKFTPTEQPRTSYKMTGEVPEETEVLDNDKVMESALKLLQNAEAYNKAGGSEKSDILNSIIASTNDIKSYIDFHDADSPSSNTMNELLKAFTGLKPMEESPVSEDALHAKPREFSPLPPREVAKQEFASDGNPSMFDTIEGLEQKPMTQLLPSNTKDSHEAFTPAPAPELAKQEFGKFMNEGVDPAFKAKEILEKECVENFKKEQAKREEAFQKKLKEESIGQQEFEDCEKSKLKIANVLEQEALLEKDFMERIKEDRERREEAFQKKLKEEQNLAQQEFEEVKNQKTKKMFEGYTFQKDASLLLNAPLDGCGVNSRE